MRPSDFYDSEIQSECESGLVRMDRKFKVWRICHHAKAAQSAERRNLVKDK